MKRQKIDGAYCKALRDKLRLNQSEFWDIVGVTQSGGSRYESGRLLPRPVRRLVWLVYVRGLDAAIVEQLAKV